jgi:hypothetical protein
MKINKLTVVASSLLAASALAQPNPPERITPASPSPASSPTTQKEVSNYIVRVQWKDGSHLQVLTSEGGFNLNTFFDKVKVGNSEVPTTVNFKGDLRVLSPEKAQLNLFLGRTVPYVTSTSGTGKTISSSYQQLQVGLNSTFVVTFGKPLVIQSDAKEEISILVKRAEN